MNETSSTELAFPIYAYPWHTLHLLATDFLKKQNYDDFIKTNVFSVKDYSTGTTLPLLFLALTYPFLYVIRALHSVSSD